MLTTMFFIYWLTRSKACFSLFLVIFSGPYRRSHKNKGLAKMVRPFFFSGEHLGNASYTTRSSTGTDQSAAQRSASMMACA